MSVCNIVIKDTKGGRAVYHLLSNGPLNDSYFAHSGFLPDPPPKAFFKGITLTQQSGGTRLPKNSKHVRVEKIR